MAIASKGIGRETSVVGNGHGVNLGGDALERGENAARVLGREAGEDQVERPAVAELAPGEG